MPNFLSMSKFHNSQPHRYTQSRNKREHAPHSIQVHSIDVLDGMEYRFTHMISVMTAWPDNCLFCLVCCFPDCLSASVHSSLTAPLSLSALCSCCSCSCRSCRCLCLLILLMMAPQLCLLEATVVP